MKLSITIKKVYSKSLYSLGLNNNILKRMSNKYIIILMYHRILKVNYKNRMIQKGMYVDPENFECQMNYIKKTFNNIHLSDVRNITNNYSGLLKDDRPYCIITFDDGWKDFFYNAFPIIKKYNIKATLFVATNYIGSNKIFWADKIAYVISEIKNKKIDVNIIDNSILNRIINNKASNEKIIENVIAYLKTIDKENTKNIIQELYEKHDINPDFLENNFLTWNEIIEIAANENIIIGSHTENHHILTSLKNNEIIQELENSRNKLIQMRVVDPEFIPFSYPNGDYNDEIVNLVKDVGYSVAVTTNYDWNPVKKNIDIFRLNRIGIHQDMTSTESMYSCRILKII